MPQKKESLWNFWSRLKIPGAHCVQDLKLHRLSYVNSHGCCCDKAMDGKPRKMALIVGACIMTSLAPAEDVTTNGIDLVLRFCNRIFFMTM